MSDCLEVEASEVRRWARSRGHQVGTRGHLPKEVIAKFNRQHRVRRFTNSNPFLTENSGQLTDA